MRKRVRFSPPSTGDDSRANDREHHDVGRQPQISKKKEEHALTNTIISPIVTFHGKEASDENPGSENEIGERSAKWGEGKEAKTKKEEEEEEEEDEKDDLDKPGSGRKAGDEPRDTRSMPDHMDVDSEEGHRNGGAQRTAVGAAEKERRKGEMIILAKKSPSEAWDPLVEKRKEEEHKAVRNVSYALVSKFYDSALSHI